MNREFYHCVSYTNIKLTSLKFHVKIKTTTLSCVTVSEFVALQNVIEDIAVYYINKLKEAYPNQIFVVYVTMSLHEALILRFHQKWDNEIDYFYEEDANAPTKQMVKIVK